MNRPEPQNSEAMTKPHSAVSNRWIELPHLEEPDGRVVSIGHDRKTQISARLALALGPADEPFETLERHRRRRNKPRDLFRGQQRQQRRRIGQPKLPECEAVAGQ